MVASGDEEIPVEEQSLDSQSLELPPSEEDALAPEDIPLGEAPIEEGTDPNLSVDDLLSAAIAEERPLPEAMYEALVPELPTFQLKLRALTAEQKTALKKLAESNALEVPENSWTGANPVISQLSEFQAVLFLQATRALGVHAQCTVSLPAYLPSEEDLALGDLSGVADELAASVVESAPSVLLPKGEKDVLLCSPAELPQSNILETFGIVIAHRSIARRMFREEDLREKLEKELLLNKIPARGQASLPSSLLQQLLRDIMQDLRKGALGKGANAVLGVKIEAFPESSSSDPQLEQLRLVAFGTAAVVEKA